MSNTPAKRPKRYTLDIEGLTMPAKFGTYDDSNGTYTRWEPFMAAIYLSDLQAKPGFDRDRWCQRCDDHDGELAIHPWSLKLPPMRPCARVRLLKDPVALPWQPGKPSQDAHLQHRHTLRPAKPIRLDACHMCLLSFLDEQEPEGVTPERLAELKADFAEARAEVSRLHQSRARETREDVLAYTDRLLQRANTRLHQAANACRDAGFEPFKPRARREGDEGPAEVGATDMEFSTDDRPAMVATPG